MEFHKYGPTSGIWASWALMNRPLAGNHIASQDKSKPTAGYKSGPTAGTSVTSRHKHKPIAGYKRRPTAGGVRAALAGSLFGPGRSKPTTTHKSGPTVGIWKESPGVASG